MDGEDLDPDRVRAGADRRPARRPAALGIDWDGEPVRQSERAAEYAAALERLRDAGLVYRCFCSRREIREAACPARRGRVGLYPGTCRDLGDAEPDRRAAAGEEHALRLRAGGIAVSFRDRLHGEVTGVADDVVLRRRDGVVAYNLAVVVDDHDQGIEEVVCGDDLLPATAAQALSLRPARDPAPGLGSRSARPRPGRRLAFAKRHGAVTLADLRDAGLTAADAVIWMARTLELAALAEQVTAADLDTPDPAGYRPSRPQSPRSGPRSGNQDFGPAPT